MEYKIQKTAVIETVAFLSILTFLDYQLGDSNRFIGIRPHPFWIIVLLVTVQYGTVNALFTSFLATLFLYVGNIPDRGIDQTYFDYQFALVRLPFLWFLASFVFGEIRMRSFYENKELRARKEELEKRVSLIVESYEKLKSNKEDLEVRVAGQLKTLSGTYEVLKELERLNPAKILYSLEDLIRMTLNPKKFSVWSHGQNGFEVILSQGWEESDPYIKRIPIQTPLYDALVTNDRILTITSRDDEEVFDGQGVLASALKDPKSGLVFGMIKIEETDFQSFNLSNLEIFKTLSELIGATFGNAERYRKMQADSIWLVPGVFYSLPLIQFFQEQLSLLKIPSTLVELKVNHWGPYEPVQGDELLARHLKELTPFVAKQKQNDGKFYLLFTNLSKEDVEHKTVSLLQNLEKAFHDIRFGVKLQEKKVAYAQK